MRGGEGKPAQRQSAARERKREMGICKVGTDAGNGGGERRKDGIVKTRSDNVDGRSQIKRQVPRNIVD